MKHSKKDKRPRESKGFAKASSRTNHRKGPIMIEDVMQPEKVFKKDDIEVREMSMRTNPTDDSSPVLKRKFIPLDNPSTILEVLQATLNIKAGVRGNNVTTGPNQYAYWRACLAGEALRKFNEFTINVGTETTVNLLIVEQRLVTEFAPRDVLTRQARYMRYEMRKPHGETTRKYVGAVGTLNETLKELPPLFNETQKIPAQELLDILASKSQQSHKALMIEHGFDPQSATLQEFVEFSERAETKEALTTHKSVSKPDSESDSGNSYKKVARKAKSKRSKHDSSYSRRERDERQEYFCSVHGSNPTHGSKTCKVLLNDGNKKKTSWKDKETKREYSDYKSKYKTKSRDLNLLQKSVQSEKEKWKALNARLRAKVNPPDDRESLFAKDEPSDDAKKPAAKARTFKPKEEIGEEYDYSSTSSSESSDSTESESSDNDNQSD